MNEIWTFSASSQELLQKCLAAAGPPDENNKWIKEFKSNAIKIIDIDDSPSMEDMDVESPITTSVEMKNDLTSTEEQFLASIDENTVINYDDITKVGMKNGFFVALANKLSVPSVDKWLKHVISIDNIEDAFLEKFLTVFFPEFLKRHYQRFCLDFMIQIIRSRPDYYTKMLVALLNDTNVPTTIVFDYVTNLNGNGKTDFMNHLLSVEFSSDMFKHNISTILLAYRQCIKSDSIQTFISQNLIRHEEVSRNDKVYGELLREYLENEKDMRRDIDVDIFSKVIDKHMSTYKRSCMMVLKEITEK